MIHTHTHTLTDIGKKKGGARPAHVLASLYMCLPLCHLEEGPPLLEERDTTMTHQLLEGTDGNLSFGRSTLQGQKERERE